MAVAFDLRVRAKLDEHPNNVGKVVEGGGEQRRLALVIELVDVGDGVEQLQDALGVPIIAGSE